MRHLNFIPTPLHKLEYYSSKYNCNLFVKRDDLFQEAGGGSKSRMLQYILTEANKYDLLITAGGPNSNFNRACALMCAKLKLPMHLIEYADDESQFNKSLNYHICSLANIKKTRCLKQEVPSTIQNIIFQYQQKGINTKFVYGGGKCIEGIYAYFEAIQEVYLQDVSIDYLFVACGTGTTLTGICAGLQKYYPHAKVYAISVARSWEIEKDVLAENMLNFNNYMDSSYTFENLVFLDNYLCGGYASTNQHLLECISNCISHEGMLIDPIYSGKAFYGMCCTIENQIDIFEHKNVLFWNTGAIFNMLS